MSEEHVTAIFGPPHVREALDRERARNATAQNIVLALRRELRRLNPSLPFEYDGQAWWELEQKWIESL